MNKQTYLKKLDTEIKTQQDKYIHISEHDYVERGITLGIIHGLLDAKSYALSLEPDISFVSKVGFN